MIGQSMPRSPLPVFVICVLPGVIITCLILVIYRGRLRSAGAGPLMLILFGDALRWGSTALLFALTVSPSVSQMSGSGVFGIAMPSVFALVALVLAKAMPLEMYERSS
jgi:hypothetical protein